MNATVVVVVPNVTKTFSFLKKPAMGSAVKGKSGPIQWDRGGERRYTVGCVGSLAIVAAVDGGASVSGRWTEKVRTDGGWEGRLPTGGIGIKK